MAALTGNSVGSSYLGLLKTTDNGVFGTTTPSVITDGAGNATPLSIAQQKLNVTQGNQVLEIDATQSRIEGDTILLQDSGAAHFIQVNTTSSAIGNNTNNLAFDATNGAFAGAVDFSGSTVTGLDTGVASVVAGTNITVDNTDPANPIVSAAGGGGGGGIEPLDIMSGENYGPTWDYYVPTGGAGPYGRFLIGYTSYLPAGTYDQFNHWVRTAATTAGATYDMAVYETSNDWPKNAALSLKPTTLVPNAVVTGVDATTTGQKLVTTATPFTVTGGYYFFAFRFDNGVDNQMEGSYAGSVIADQKYTYNAGLGFPTPYQFAGCKFNADALTVGTAGEYTSMPSDLTSETTFGNTSYRLAFTVVAQ